MLAHPSLAALATPLARSEPSAATPWLDATPFRGRLGGASLVLERPDDGASPLPPPASPPAPRLGQRARAAMRMRHFSPRTEDAYLGWMRRYYEFNGRRDPVELGAAEVTAFLNMLATPGGTR